MIDESWYRRYFESGLYEEFNLGNLGPELTVEQVNRAIRWLDLAPGLRVLDLCCGAGRHSSELARRGLRVVALDLSSAQLARARSRLWPNRPQPDFVRGDARLLPARSESFDVALCLYNSFGYFSDDENLQVLREIRRTLRPGGRLLLDTINRDSFLIHQSERTWDRVASGWILQEIAFSVRTSHLITRWTRLAAGHEPETITSRNRLYSAHELCGLCEGAGLEVLDLNDGENWSHFDWRQAYTLAVVARRKP